MGRLQQLHDLDEAGALFAEEVEYNKWIFTHGKYTPSKFPPVGVEVLVWPAYVDHFGLKGVYYGGEGYGSWGVDGIQEASEKDIKAWRINNARRTR